MGTFNIVHAHLKCPRCGTVVDAEIEVRLGNTAQMQYLKVGDTYPWVQRARPEEGGRPPEGNVNGDGYLECPRCHKDSFVRVLVRSDVIVAIEPDLTRPGYIPD